MNTKDVMSQELGALIASQQTVKHDESIFRESYEDVKASANIGYIYRRNELDHIKERYATEVQELYGRKVRAYLDEVEKISPDMPINQHDSPRLIALKLFPDSDEKDDDTHESILRKLLNNEEESSFILKARTEQLAIPKSDRQRAIVEAVIEYKKEELEAFAKIRAGADYFKKVLKGEKDIIVLNNILFDGRVY